MRKKQKTFAEIIFFILFAIFSSLIMYYTAIFALNLIAKKAQSDIDASKKNVVIHFDACIINSAKRIKDESTCQSYTERIKNIQNASCVSGKTMVQLMKILDEAKTNNCINP